MEMAEWLGAVLAGRDIELVYGGAETGLMGRIADTVLRAGGRVTGIIPRSFAHRVSHRGLTELRVVDSMHERKMAMFGLSDGFIALPGVFLHQPQGPLRPRVDKGPQEGATERGQRPQTKVAQNRRL